MMRDPTDDKRTPSPKNDAPLAEPDAIPATNRSELSDDIPTLKLGIVPGNASAEEIADFLTALSNLHIAHGGGGIDFTVAGVNGSTVLLEGRFMPLPETITMELPAEEMTELVALGGYTDPTQFLKHSLAVTRALLDIQEGEILIRNGFTIEPFDLLKMDTEIRGMVLEALQTPLSDRKMMEVAFLRTDNLEKLMRLGEFSSVEQCVNLTLNVLSRIVAIQSEGGDLVRKVGEDLVPIDLPPK